MAARLASGNAEYRAAYDQMRESQGVNRGEQRRQRQGRDGENWCSKAYKNLFDLGNCSECLCSVCCECLC